MGAVSVRAGSGNEVTTAIPITMKSKSDNSLIGTIGNGACRMLLQTANGGIEIH